MIYQRLKTKAFLPLAVSFEEHTPSLVFGAKFWIAVYQRHQNIGNILDAPNTNSLYRSRVGRHFYGTENKIWAGFVPVGNTEKNEG